MERCTTCGAPLTPGRVGCFYCGAGEPSSSLRDLAALPSLDAAAVDQSLASFAQELEARVPGQIQLEKSLLGGHIRSLSADMGTSKYLLRREQHRFVCEVQTVSNGVVLSRSVVPLADWTRSLLQSLQAYIVTYGADPAILSTVMPQHP